MRIRTMTVCGIAAAVTFATLAGAVAVKEKSGKAEAKPKASISVAKETNDQLIGMAKISLADAVAAALAKVPGKAWKAELEAEDGALIYTVQVMANATEWKEVAVDAGNGAVLKVEAGDQEEFEGTAKKTGKGTRDPRNEGKGSDGDND